MVSGVKDEKLKKELMKNLKNKKVSDDNQTPKRRSTFFGFGTKKENNKSIDPPINNENGFTCEICKKPGNLQCTQCEKV